ncbi:MAG: hypothetical protein IKT34_04030 [Clostridia bacterium]|nr:hypothetical protein [Clostridia bacterium]
MNYEPNFNGQEINFSALAVRKLGGSKKLFFAALLFILGSALSLLMEVILLFKADSVEFDFFSVGAYLFSLAGFASTVIISLGLFKFYKHCNGESPSNNGLKTLLYGVAASYVIAILNAAIQIELTGSSTEILSAVISIAVTGYVYYLFFCKIKSSVDHIESALAGNPRGRLSRLLGFMTCTTFVLLAFVAFLYFTTNAGLDALMATETDPNMLADLQYLDSIYDELKYMIYALTPTAISNLLFFILIKQYKSKVNLL